jgi:hypothetical protein
MLPLLILAVGGYLVYDSVKKPVKYADGGKIDMQTLGVDLKSIKNKYPNANVSWSLAKDSSGKGYVITAKEGSKIVYSSYKMADGGMMAKGGMTGITIIDVLHYPSKKRAFNGEINNEVLNKIDKYLSFVPNTKQEYTVKLKGASRGEYGINKEQGDKIIEILNK